MATAAGPAPTDPPRPRRAGAVLPGRCRPVEETRPRLGRPTRSRPSMLDAARGSGKPATYSAACADGSMSASASSIGRAVLSLETHDGSRSQGRARMWDEIRKDTRARTTGPDDPLLEEADRPVRPAWRIIGPGSDRRRGDIRPS